MKRGLFVFSVLCMGLLIGAMLQKTLGLLPTGSSGSIKQGQAWFADGSARYSRDPGSANLTPESPQAFNDLSIRLDEAALHDQRQLEKIAELRARVALLEKRTDGENAATAIEEAEKLASPSPDPVTEPSGEASLIAAGIDEQTAIWIQRQLDANQMEELLLRNQATREGWLNSNRYHKARKELRDRFSALREEIGEEDYGRLLYAQGRHNRVVILDAIHNSPAQEYGLQRGDLIVRYDGNSVFTSADLQKLTMDGDTSSSAMIEIVRDGNPMTLYVPGGPLGVRLAPRRIGP